jgi:hypothetical protein
VLERYLARGVKYAWKDMVGIVGLGVREMVPFWLIVAVRVRGEMQLILLRYDAIMTSSFTVHCSVFGMRVEVE